MNRTMILAMARHALTIAGGALVSAGYVDDATAQAGIGAVLTLAGIGWSLAEKRGR